MCGFGDKDRRPLAPAVVAKLVVRRDDNTIVDSEYTSFNPRSYSRLILYRELDYSFFLVTVDLWSEDGKREVNLVLHPILRRAFCPNKYIQIKTSRH
ncbi:hypothetical protein F5887DRAFT_217818 [Amanita rubescens]|nr:hypothetical protein F5887DRAFT_217818 [Amanita rubescens]